jgi:hypothetical protein
MDDGGRVGVHDHLTEGVVPAGRLVDVHGQVLQKLDHRGHVGGVDTVFRLFGAEQAGYLGVLEYDAERKKPQRSFRERSSWKLDALALSEHEGERLSGVVGIDTDRVDPEAVSADSRDATRAYTSVVSPSA